MAASSLPPNSGYCSILNSVGGHWCMNVFSRIAAFCSSSLRHVCFIRSFMFSGHVVD